MEKAYNQTEGGWCFSNSFKRTPIFCAIGIYIGMGMAHAQSYINADGTSSIDLVAAAKSWADDPEFKGNWGQAAMNSQFAYARNFTGKGIKLGSVDSGLKTSHPEFLQRNPVKTQNSGTYLNDGVLDPAKPTVGAWHAGDGFNVSGEYTPPINDNHGSHVSGTIAAARNGITKDPKGNTLGMMGIAFDSEYYISNTNGADGAIYGPNMDYNYFNIAYGNLVQDNVRAINSSWGSPGVTSDTKTVEMLVNIYSRYFLLAGKKTWLQATGEITRENDVLQIFAAGNTSKAHINIRSSLPFFEPDLENRWIAVPALTSTLAMATFSNLCGVAKYWCISAPGDKINSLSVSSATGYQSSSGTSMAAPHVTGALGILMQRYPSLSNEAVRTILLTTARHLGDGETSVPNVKFGWGIPDLNKAMSGPSQLMGSFDARVDAGQNDVWANAISQTAMVQRKADEAAEIAAFPAQKAALLAQKVPAGDPKEPDNIVIDTAVAAWQKRIDILAAKTAADYESNLIKTGQGALTLAAINTYTGTTEVRAGTLKTGVPDALALSAVKVASGATLDITTSGNAQIPSMVNAGTVNMADGIAGQTLTVNGTWAGQQGIVNLDVVPSAPQATPVQQKAGNVLADKVVFNGAVSGVTKLNISGLQDIDPADIASLVFVQSAQPLPAGSVILAAPVVIRGQNYVLQSNNNGGMTLVVAPPTASSATAVPTMNMAGLGLLSAMLAGFVGFFSRRKRQTA